MQALGDEVANAILHFQFAIDLHQSRFEEGSALALGQVLLYHNGDQTGRVVSKAASSRKLFCSVAAPGVGAAARGDGGRASCRWHRAKHRSSGRHNRLLDAPRGKLKFNRQCNSVWLAPDWS